MYRVIKALDGTIHCHGRLRDSTERWQAETVEEAVESLIKFARVCNGVDITSRSIAFYQEQEMVTTKLALWRPRLRRGRLPRR